METEKKTRSFFLQKNRNLLLEALFHSFWESLKPGSELNTPDQGRIRILHPGVWNGGREPDFRAGRILFRGRELEGDIVLHENASDYIKSGYLARGDCSDVILHAFIHDDIPRVPGKENSSMSHILECHIPYEILVSGKPESGRCRIFPCMSHDMIRDFFLEAGREHLQRKSITILEDMIHYGTEKAFCKILLQASGNKYNKAAFSELWNRINEYERECFRENYKTILWGESSLLPDISRTGLPPENRLLVQELWEKFWGVRQSSQEKILWKTHRIRPFNSPERRIAMICAFFDKFTVAGLDYFAAQLLESGGKAFLRKMKKELILSDPFWDRHCNFRTGPMQYKAAVLGSKQAETLLTDAVIPALLALGKLHGNPALETAGASLTEELPPRRDLPQFRETLKNWFPGRESVEKIFENGCMTQGLLYMAERCGKNCDKECSACPLAEL